MDRLRHLIAALSAVAFLGCKADKPTERAPSRFDSVETSSRASKAHAAFCERTFPQKGEGSRRWTSPPSRPVPKEKLSDRSGGAAGGGWTWVNLWASWCGPCLQEMPLLERWRASLEKDGLGVRFELWSVDEDEKDFVSALDRKFPGEVRWLRSEEDLPAFLDSLGLERNTAIPVHALVDAEGMLRCVRVGQVNEGSYGTIKAILAGG
jgi:thiol-disulfide isomerase/thioredoxin